MDGPFSAQPERVEAAGAKTTFIFRVAGEWLALPPALFLEILEKRPVHSLPHRRKGVVLGLVNVRAIAHLRLAIRLCLAWKH